MNPSLDFLQRVSIGLHEGTDERGIFWRITQATSSKWEIFYGPKGQGKLQESEYSPGTSLGDAKRGVALQIRYETDPAFRRRRDQRDQQRRRKRAASS